MTRDEIKSKVIENIAEHFQRDVDSITEDTRIVEDLGGSSIDEMEFTLDLEEYYKIDLFKDTTIKKILTVKQLIDLCVAAAA